MNAQLIAGALGGKKVGTSWLAFCPAHENHLTPSLALRDDSGGRILVHCHAGCEQRAVVAALRARGLWGTNGSISSSWEQHSRPNGELVLASTKVIEAIARPEAVPTSIPTEQLEALLDLSLQRD